MKAYLRIAVLASAVLSQAGLVRRAPEDTSADSLALLAHAKQLQDLRAEGDSPFRLRAHIEVKVNKSETQGEYGLIWQAPNRWREEMKLGDFGRLRVGAGGGYWQERTIDYQPEIIFDLDEFIFAAEVLEVRPTETVDKPKSRKIDDITVSCVEIRGKRSLERELCFDPAGGVLLHANFPERALHGATVNKTVDFSDVQPFGDKQIVRNIRIERPGRYQMRISFTSLAPTSEIDATAFAQPAHSEFWQGCGEGSSAEISSAKSPEYPAELRRNRQEGLVSVYARIEPDGFTSHLVTLNSASPALERAARDAIRQWKYKVPACGGPPARSETVIDIFFWIPR